MTAPKTPRKRAPTLAQAEQMALHTHPVRSAQTLDTADIARLCELHAVSVSYGARLANDSVSLQLRPGEVVALLGENGAGKSTLLHALYGLVPISSGTVYYGPNQVQPSPERAIENGIGLVSQHFLLIPRLSVAENIILGREPRRKGFLDLPRAEEQVAELGRRFGLAIDPRRRVGDLSVGEAQRVEILKALYRGARCLLLDEPTAVLTPHEARHLLHVLRELCVGSFADKPSGLLIVTHKLDEVIDVADRAVVMRAGRVVAEFARASFSAQAMAHALVGRELLPVVRKAAAASNDSKTAAQPVLRVHDLHVTQGGVERVCGVSFALSSGSILGLAGVEGNGQSELCAALVGLLRPTSGTVVLDEKDLTTAEVKTRRAAGLSFVLEDRQRHGLVLDFSLTENLLLGEQARYRQASWPPLRWLIARRRLQNATRELLAMHDVRPPDPTLLARALSGGNQQKLLLGRAIGRPEECPKVLIAAQPTRGVDLGAVQAIHRLLLETRDRGSAILLFSTELDELRTLCDHIAVMYRGRIVANLPNPPAAPISRERLGELLSGVG